MNKKTFLLAVALLGAASAFATDFVVDGVKYTTIDENSVFVPAQEYTNPVLNIPGSVTYDEQTYAVDYIDEKAFYLNESLTTITIGAREVKNEAFSVCRNVVSITLLEGVEVLNGNNVFSNSAITELHIPASLTAFASENTYLLPTNFCEKLKNITVDENNSKYCSVSGTMYSKDMKTVVCCPTLNEKFTEFPASVTKVNQGAFFDHIFTADTLYIPASITEFSRAFHRISVKHLVIDGTSVCKNSFQNASVKTITLGKNVNYIRELSFYNVKDCEKITIYSETMPEWEYGTDSGWPCFNGANNVFYVDFFVPCGQETTYATNANKWANFVVSEFLPYTLTATSSNEEQGTVTIEEVPDCFIHGRILAEPKDGFEFKQWNDGDTDNPRSIQVVQDTAFVAEFAVKSTVAIENVELANVYAQNGRIFGIENARIFDILGRDVTKENGKLRGTYIVRTATAAIKLIVE